MIYVETSAIVGILLEEDDAGELLLKLSSAGDRKTSVVSAVEAGIAVGKSVGSYALGSEIVLQFLSEMRVHIVAAEPGMYDDVLRAAARYGKGSGHPAKLNFGDCFSYAFAKREGLPILFKGSDFSKTDLQSA